MTKKLKIILIIFAICLVGVGVFCFSDNWKRNENQLQTAQNLKLLSSHAQPQAGEEWVVFFETTGEANLTITPKDQDTIGDLDLISLKCGDEIRSPQILGNDVIFYSGWQCADRGELTHLVNIARKHTLEFQFGDGMAYAYNNPDSITDTFNNTNYIFSTSNITVNTTTGQVYLATCGNNGVACTLGSECCLNNCIDGYCCNSACGGNCDRCNVGGSLGTCTNVDSDCTGNCDVCSGGNCAASASLCTGNCDDCSGSGTSFNCAANAAYCTGNCDVCSGSGTAYNCAASNGLCSSTDNSCYCSGSGTAYNCVACACKTCSSYSCSSNKPNTTWNAGLYNCIGSDKRCYSGTCYDCSDQGGFLAADQLGGQGCWYYTGTGNQNCNTICSLHGSPASTCIATNWNDDGVCTVFLHFLVGCSCQAAANLSSYPSAGMGDWGEDICRSRVTANQDCASSDSRRRICVCQY